MYRFCWTQRNMYNTFLNITLFNIDLPNKSFSILDPLEFHNLRRRPWCYVFQCYFLSRVFPLPGLRGAIPYALSLHLGLEPIEKRQLIGTTTIIIVLFTILFLGGGTMPLIRIMDIEESQSRRKSKKDINLSKTEKMVRGDESLWANHAHIRSYSLFCPLLWSHVLLSAIRLVLCPLTCDSRGLIVVCLRMKAPTIRNLNWLRQSCCDTKMVPIFCLALGNVLKCMFLHLKVKYCTTWLWQPHLLTFHFPPTSFVLFEVIPLRLLPPYLSSQPPVVLGVIGT